MIIYLFIITLERYMAIPHICEAASTKQLASGTSSRSRPRLIGNGSLRKYGEIDIKLHKAAFYIIVEGE